MLLHIYFCDDWSWFKVQMNSKSIWKCFWKSIWKKKRLLHFFPPFLGFGPQALSSAARSPFSFPPLPVFSWVGRTLHSISWLERVRLLPLSHPVASGHRIVNQSPLTELAGESSPSAMAPGRLEHCSGQPPPLVLPPLFNLNRPSRDQRPPVTDTPSRVN